VSINGSDRPRLARRARLRFDELTRAHVLLCPERGLLLNEPAAAILLLCGGDHTVDEIASRLATHADAARVRTDVVELLTELRARRLIEIDGGSA
jgi:pyrroloquinoline quinone biosynthesis protein D